MWCGWCRSSSTHAILLIRECPYLRPRLLCSAPSSSQLTARISQRCPQCARSRVCAEADHPPHLPTNSARGRRRRGLHGGQDVRAGPLSSARRCSLLLSSGVLVVRVRVCFTASQPLCVCVCISPLILHSLRVLCPQDKSHQSHNQKHKRSPKPEAPTYTTYTCPIPYAT